MSVVVLTYHGISRDGGPLALGPELFAEQLDALREEDASFLTVSQVADAVRARELPERAVAITFDDGLTSVAEEAAPLLAERGLPATVFCVAGRLGADSDWPSARPGAARLPLLAAPDLAELAANGFEIGSHGMEHAPLVGGSEPQLHREIVESRRVLEQAVGVPVSSFAYPYGAGPVRAARVLVEETYAAACTTALGAVTTAADVHSLPRVDVHYVRSPQLLRRALSGSLGPYLRARAIGARARRKLVKDYA
jgi:peptidoglycan/xylan/chitin deacetylase (PgdA/CDA1 family)